jgi:hypothetical protein
MSNILRIGSISAHMNNVLFKKTIKSKEYRVPHTYHVNDKVMMRKGTKNKYEVPFNGSHKILKVITNGTVHLRFGFLTNTIKTVISNPTKQLQLHSWGRVQYATF